MAKASKQKAAVPEKATKGKEVATVGDYADFEQYAGAGLQNVTGQDLLIPRLTILQALSPQVNPRKPEFIEGAKPGDICDVGTAEIFEPPLIVLPVIFVKQWLEWAPRNTGKGLVRVHDTKDILQHTHPDERGRPILDSGNSIAETAQFYILNLSAMGRRSFVPMASTQLKKARGWLTKVTAERVIKAEGGSFTPPFFFRIYELSVIEESNNDGDWFGWKIEKGQPVKGDNQHGPIDGWQDLVTEARAFERSILAGEARGDVASMGDEPAGAIGGRSRAADETDAM